MKISAMSALAILFVALKLTGIISWSWWLVLAPAWGGAILWLLFVGLALWAAMLASPGKGFKGRFR